MSGQHANLNCTNIERPHHFDCVIVNQAMNVRTVTCIREGEYPILKAYFLKLNLTFAFPYTMQGHDSLTDQLPIVQDVTSIENSKKHIGAQKREAKRKMTRSCGEQLFVSCAGDKGSSSQKKSARQNGLIYADEATWVSIGGGLRYANTTASIVFTSQH
ncbi:hypothetical protein CBL_07170 [Carabus blaptoides fortunei]